MKTSYLVTALSLALCACSGSTVKNTLGLGRSAPDEYRVVSRPPLSVPPQFTLRPPSATDLGPGQAPADEQAKSMVLGGDKNEDTPVRATATNSASSTAESQFLKNAGADKADPSVRNKLIEEKITAEDKSDSWWDIISTNPPKKDTLVNAKKESERIQKNEDEGKPVNEGDTPTVKDRDTGVLGRIFGY